MPTPDRAAPTGQGLLAVGASAGSGKTTRLTKEVLAAVTSAEGAVPIASLIAVTFTKKAASELVSRMRRQLCRSRAISPVDLGAAYIGTVHAVCLRLVREFALEAGVSPDVEVLPDDDGRLLREVLEREIPAGVRARMTALAGRFQIRWDSRVRRHDWVTPIEDIMNLARSNRVAPKALDEMAERSIAGLMKLLPPDEVDGPSLDADLAKEIAATLPELLRIDDGQDNTEKAIARLRSAARHADVADLPWGEWAHLSRITPGKSCKPAVVKLMTIAGQFDRHPRFRSELREYVRGAFLAARAGLERFAEWKARRRVIDYVDMIDTALTLVDTASVRAELEQRTRLVVVDEFQDTSPIQLALFTSLHRIAGHSIWVGDRKQCIFEYAGADPDLMNAALAWCRRAGGVVDQLGFNFRSRPELVEATNAVFTVALALHGFAEDEVRAQAKRDIPPSVQGLPPIGLWLLEARTDDAEAHALAAGVARLLSRADDTNVVDPESGAARPVRPCDIALLVATNDEAKAIAKALQRAGVPAALPRDGLLTTPEGTLLTSALELLHDRSSTMAAATIDALLGFGGVTPDRWLNQLLARQAGGHETVDEPSSRLSSEAVRTLEGLRPQVDVLSPTELVDLVIARLELPRLCARWPDPAQRLGNLDAYRALTRDYEQRCRYAHEEASLAGLLRFLKAAGSPTLRRDEMRAMDHQHVRSSADAVTICTYHRAKGLEWPIVVLSSLDRPRKRTPFDVTPDSDHPEFDPDAPLAGRWIRYWPWPLGQLKNAPLADIAARSAEGRRTADDETLERLRLLYVGFTRARDHLILAARLAKGGPRVPWLDELADSNGRPVVRLPDLDHEGHLTEIKRPLEETLKIPTRVWRLSAEGNERAPSRQDRTRWFSRPAVQEPRPSFWVAPSRAAAEWSSCAEFEVGEVVRLGEGIAPGLELPTDEWPRFGHAVHAFLAADDEESPPEARVAMARRLLAAAALSSSPLPEALPNAADTLHGFVRARWAGSRIHREIPVLASIQDAPRRQLRGSIDLLVETPDGLIVIDHKTFPGRGESAWRAQAREHGPQVVAYLRALSTQPCGKTRGGWIHFAATGALVEIRALTLASVPAASTGGPDVAVRKSAAQS